MTSTESQPIQLENVWATAVDHHLAADVFVTLAALAFAAATFLYGVIASASGFSCVGCGLD